MKNMCNKLMSLECGKKPNEDFGPVVFMHYLRYIDYDFSNTIEFGQYLLFFYRFYIDNPALAKRHKNITIKNIVNCKPKDLYLICLESIAYIRDKTKLFYIYDGNIIWSYEKIFFDSQEKEAINSVVDFLTTKFTGFNSFIYNPELTIDDYSLINNSEMGSKLFNRCIENIKYCFICEDDNLNNLKVIRLLSDNNPETIYNINNYTCLCKKHAELFNKEKITILENGKAYDINNKCIGRMEIKELKRIRPFIREKYR